ncbi:MAG: hypothetical protein IEMM0002_0678 [bacterium]|nr:MAG: hypothetical protein IEMM0002_0678 [bacterium]
MDNVCEKGKTLFYWFIAGALLLAMPTAVYAGKKPPVPKTVTGVKIISHDKLKSMLETKKLGSDFFIYDSRKASDYEAGRISGAVHLPVPGKPDLGATETKKAVDKMSGKLPSDKSKMIVFYCNGLRCWRSPKASKAAVSMGYSNVGWLRDGFPEWQKKGYPVE